MRIIRSVAPAVVLLLAATGCGDDAKDSDDDDSSTSESTADPGTEAPTDAEETDAEETDAEETDAVETDSGDDAGGCYLSDADVAAATGIDGAAVDSSVAGTTICTWTSTTGDNINLSIKPETGTFDATVSATEGVIGPSEPLSGVGDEAVILSGDDVLPQAAVIAQVGDQLVALIYTSADGDEASLRTAVTDLTTTVAANLG